MNLIAVIFAIFFITLVGYSIIKTLKFMEDSADVEKLPYSFGLGAGLIAYQLYLYSRLNLEWDRVTIILPWAIFIVLSLLIKRLSFELKYKKQKFSPISTILIVSIFTLFIFVTIEAVSRPLPAWDGWASWLLRSKIFFIEGGVKQSMFAYIPSEYPELVSLMSTFVYKVLGLVDDRNVLLIYPAFYISIAGMFFFSLRKKTTTNLSLFFTFLLVSTQNIIRHSGRFEVGQADVILGFYIFSSLLLLLKFIKNKSIGSLVLLQLFLAVTVLIKNEGVPFVLLTQLIIVIFLFKQKLYGLLTVLAIWLFPFLEWQYFKSMQNLAVAPSYLGSQIHLDRLVIISKLTFQEFINIKNWNFLWVSFFASLVIYILYIKKQIETSIIYLVVLIQVGVYAGVFFFTSTNPLLHIPNVLNRALLHLAPAAVYAVSLTFVEIKKKYLKL